MKVMNIRELRVGNYIFSDTNRVTLIDGFLQDSVYENIKDERVKYILSQIAYCKPIPLTEEWLLKFGFKEVDKNLFQYESGYLVGYYVGKWFIGKYNFDDLVEMMASFDFVHQLQNVFYSLTGEELEIKNKV